MEEGAPDVTCCGDCHHKCLPPGTPAGKVGCIATLEFHDADGGGDCEASKHWTLYDPAISLAKQG